MSAYQVSVTLGIVVIVGFVLWLRIRAARSIFAWLDALSERRAQRKRERDGE